MQVCDVDLAALVEIDLAGALAANRLHPAGCYPLHIGDTWLPPAVDLTWNDVAPGLDPAPHRYSEPRGIAPLREAIRKGLRTTISYEDAMGKSSRRTIWPSIELSACPSWPASVRSSVSVIR